MVMTPEEKKAKNKAYHQANKAKSKAYYQANKAVVIERARLWKIANREKCRLSRNKSYASNIDKEKAAGKEYRDNNREKTRKAVNEHYRKNKDRLLANKKIYRKEHLEEYKKTQMKWRHKNPDAPKRWQQNRRARIEGNGGTLSKDIIQKLWKFQKGKCAVCKKSLKKTGYHLDHIVPLSKGGKNDDGNAQLTCPTCNLKKGNKDPIRFMQEMGYLL